MPLPLPPLPAAPFPCPCGARRKIRHCLYVTENGQSCNDRVFLDGKVHDPERIDYTRRYLMELEKAVENGVPVKGYYHWSFMDNFEWSNGYDERFGLVYVDDTHDLRRIPKDSFYWYQEVIRTGKI